jgi:hypothetical protein
MRIKGERGAPAEEALVVANGIPVETSAAEPLKLFE